MPIRKPDWWPENPYPEEIFPMPRSEFKKIVSNPHIRSALSGMLGRLFWTTASDMIWEAWQNHESEKE